MRVSLPDRPGSLGAVASAMGTVGADILAVEIVEKGVGFAIDDFMITVPPGVLPDMLVSACNDLADVRVLWLSHYPEHWGLESDIEVLERMIDQPDNAAEILAEAAPVVFHCHWGLVVDRGKHPRLLFATGLAPDLDESTLGLLGPLDEIGRVELAQGWLPHWPDTLAAVAPLKRHRAIVIGRQGGPGFLDSELARLGHLAALAH